MKCFILFIRDTRLIGKVWLRMSCIECNDFDYDMFTDLINLFALRFGLIVEHGIDMWELNMKSVLYGMTRAEHKKRKCNEVKRRQRAVKLIYVKDIFVLLLCCFAFNVVILCFECL